MHQGSHTDFLTKNAYPFPSVEAHNHAREMFGFPRLEMLLAQRPRNVNVTEFVRAHLTAFIGLDWEQEDDITMVSLQNEDRSQK